MKNLKKNQVVILVIALMLITAGYLNYSNQNITGNLLPTSTVVDTEQIAGIGDATLVNANEVSEENINNQEVTNEISNEQEVSNNVQENFQNSDLQEQDGYFAQSRLDREKMYSLMLENYQKILETEGLSSEEKNTAQEEIKKINSEKNAIMIAENLIKTKGFEDIVLFVNNGNVTGVVKAEKLDETRDSTITKYYNKRIECKAK